MTTLEYDDFLRTKLRNDKKSICISVLPTR